tara:strand:+ start:116 stop:304 length:189 start_codon:yes stop_codon:yes gene_type:complete
MRRSAANPLPPNFAEVIEDLTEDPCPTFAVNLTVAPRAFKRDKVINCSGDPSVAIVTACDRV